LTDFVVDSSVVAKWFIDEPGRDQARELIAPTFFLRAPDLIVSELTNVLWKKATRGELTPERVRERLVTIVRDHIGVTVHLLPTRILSNRALQIALATGRSAYDCLYLAAAVQAKCRLVTADERFVRAIKDPVLRRHMVTLDMFAGEGRE
jgi:predicted nucleic acid-binding protein